MSRNRCLSNARTALVVWACLGATLGTTRFASAQDRYPYTLDAARELTLTVSGAALLGAGVAIDHSKPPYTQDELATLNVASINGFDRGATRNWSPSSGKASDILMQVSILAPMGLLLTDQGSREPWTLTTMYVETVLLNNGIVLFVKAIAARTRPFVYNDDPRIPIEKKLSRDARRSFPSGHAANAFAGATFLGIVHQKLYPGSSSNAWVWAGSLTMATATGILRYTAGKHFPSDILVGAIVGATVGWLVPKLHEIDESSGETGAMKMPVLSFSVGF